MSIKIQQGDVYWSALSLMRHIFDICLRTSSNSSRLSGVSVLSLKDYPIHSSIRFKVSGKLKKCPEITQSQMLFMVLKYPNPSQWCMSKKIN